MTLTYGVHSEAGTLRRVLVHRPGSEMARLTPANREALLFDDVIWVKQARVEHLTFTDMLRERGVDVVFLREMLEEVLADPVARKWVLDARIADGRTGSGHAIVQLVAKFARNLQRAASHISRVGDGDRKSVV